MSAVGGWGALFMAASDTVICWVLFKCLNILWERSEQIRMGRENIVAFLGR